MLRTRVGHVSLGMLVVAAAIVAVLAAQSKLAWAWQALESYAGGTTTTPDEYAQEQEALRLLQLGGEPDEIRALLERVVAVDPHARAVHLLGDVYLRQGDRARAETQYRRYLEIDRSFLPGWLRLAELLAAAGRDDERTALLRQAVEHYAAEVERFRPHEDDAVPEVFNSKAVAVHNGYREALDLLGAMLAQAEGNVAVDEAQFAKPAAGAGGG